MKAIVYDWYTDIYPSDEEVKSLCKIGQGADTCIWLVMSPDGWECTCLHRPHALLDRWEKGLTVAKRNGCDPVNNFDPSGLEGEAEINVQRS